MNILVVSKISQAVLSFIIVALVLIQSKTAGLSPGLKSSFNTYGSLRGVEKIIFVSSIVSGALLVVNSLLIVLFS